jgi:anti-sigma regulatory factor (Ser/Thr protein kinase)/CheY-like chemotaxis protein
LSSRRLLLIDDDPGVQAHLLSLLQRDDREIDQCAEGHAALHQLKLAHYDVVVAGQGRNGFGGLELLRKVLAVRPEAKVIVTGDPDPVLILGAIRSQAFSYFHKPVADSPLAEMVQQAIEATSWKNDIRVVSGRPDWITLDVRCRLEALDRTVHFVREVSAPLASQFREDVAMALRELLMNAVEHGGNSDPRKRVRLSIFRTQKALTLLIDDYGPGFNIDLLPHAAISNPEDSPTRHVEIRAEAGQRPGGFGLLMVRNLADELLFNERGNSVMFVKYFEP